MVALVDFCMQWLGMVEPHWSCSSSSKFVEILQRANGRIVLWGFSVVEKGCDNIISYAKSWQ